MVYIKKSPGVAALFEKLSVAEADQARAERMSLNFLRRKSELRAAIAREAAAVDKTGEADLFRASAVSFDDVVRAVDNILFVGIDRVASFGELFGPELKLGESAWGACYRNINVK